MLARAIIILFFHLSLSLKVHGQDFYVDSLRNVLSQSQSTTDQINACIALGSNFQKVDPEQSDEFFMRGLILARSAGRKSEIAQLLSNLGWNRYLASEYAAAMAYYDTCAVIVEELIVQVSGNAAALSEVQSIKGNNLRNIGVIHDARSDYPEALKYYLQALNVYEAVQNFKGMAKVYGSIGVSYTDTRDFDLALRNFERSIAIHDSLGLPNENRSNFINLGNLHYAWDNPEQALNYYKQAAKINELLGDVRSMSIVLGNMASIFLDRGQLDSALVYHEKARAFGAKLGNIRVEIIHMSNTANVYLDMGENTKAEALYREAQTLAEKIGAIDLLRDIHLQLADILASKGRYEEAYSHYQDYTILRDSIANDEGRKELMRQQFEYDFEKREALIKAEQDKKDALATEELKRRDQQRNALIGGFILMVVLATVSYRSYRMKKRDNAIISSEKARSESLLLNILPKDVADELKAKGSAEARQIEHVTVLFTDFKGFTQLSERLSPKLLVGEIHACFSAFDAIMRKHGVEKIKTIGDAYMAAGGLPTPNTSHAVDVVKAAIDIQHYMLEHKRNKEAKGEPYFEIRIGVHSGPVVAGIVGVNKFQYDIWGDTVNTASRMESSGEVGKINISAATCALIGDLFKCEYRGEIEAKGKGKMGMYFVEPIS